MTVTKSQRLIFIDVLRGLAVILMIEAHTMALMSNLYKQGFLYGFLNISNGFVSVAFLFCAGAGFWLAVKNKFNDFKHFKKPLWTYIRRLAFILMLAYFLHFPVFTLSKFLNMNQNQLNILFQNDILQTIVYSSSISLILLLILPKLTHLKYISIILTIIAFSLVSIVWYSNPFDYLPYNLAFMFAKPPISKFPLIPWSGYFFAGIFVTAFFMEAKDKINFAKKLLYFSLSIITIIFFLKFIGIPYLSGYQFWYANPIHCLFRLSGTTAIFAFLFLLEKYYKNYKLTNILLISGRESLFIYMIHLIIIYGSVLNVGLKYFNIQNLNPYETFGMYTAITFISISLARGWHEIKNNSPKVAKQIMYSLAIFCFLYFILN